MQLLHRKTRRLPGSSSRAEAEVSEEGRGVEAEDKWWTSTLWTKKGAKTTKRRSLGSLKAECVKLAHTWLTWGNDPTKRLEDHSSTDVLKWWKDNEPRRAEVADLARRQLCAPASSGTSEHAFLKAGLIVSKKRRGLTVGHVDGISLMGWHCKDNGWVEVAKRPRCGAEMEMDRH